MSETATPSPVHNEGPVSIAGAVKYYLNLPVHNDVYSVDFDIPLGHLLTDGNFLCVQMQIVDFDSNTAPEEDPKSCVICRYLGVNMETLSVQIRVFKNDLGPPGDGQDPPPWPSNTGVVVVVINDQGGQTSDQKS